MLKPKHKNSDPKVRLNAVETINDEKTLFSIAKSDDVWQIRKKAVSRINDKSILGSLFLSENDCAVLNEIKKKYNNPADLFNDNLNDYGMIMNRLERFADCHDLKRYLDDIIKGIGDQELFAYLVNNTSNYNVRDSAFRELSDLNLLLDIAENCTHATYYGSYRELAFKKIEQLYPESFLNPEKVSTITDEEQLVKIAKDNINPKNRIAAIDKIDDEEVLMDIIRNDSDSKVRCEAVKRIDNQEILVKLAKNSEDTDVLVESIRKIDDDNILIDIYRNASDWHVHDAAVGKISDESFLIDIAKNIYDDGNSIRRIAVLGIHDETALMDIYNNESDGFVRENIVKNITDGEVLKNILLNDSCAAVRINVIKNPHFNDEKTLKRIVTSDPYYTINEERNNEDFSLYSRQYKVRMAANKKLGGGYDRYCEESTDRNDHGAIGSC